MVKRRVGHHKLLLPTPLEGGESPQEQDLVYYGAKSILEMECRGVNFDIRVRCLSNIMNMDFIAQKNMANFILSYES